MAVILNKTIKSIVITISFVGLLGFLFCLPISSKAEEKNVVSEEFLNYLNDSVFVSDPMNTNHLSEVKKKVIGAGTLLKLLIDIFWKLTRQNLLQV